MSEILTYGSKLVTDAQVTKMGTFTSKGGGLMVQVQLPLDSGLAGVIATHLGNIARLTLEFSSVKPETGRRGGDGGQRDLFGGPTAEPAPKDEPHQAGEERIASTCPACGGVSYVGEGSEEACELCGGTGVVYSAPGEHIAMVPCGACDGVGNKPDTEGVFGPCEVCRGTGKVAAEVTDDPLGDAVNDLADEDEAQDEAGEETVAKTEEAVS